MGILNVYAVDYITDSGNEITIKVNYLGDNTDARIIKGGFEVKDTSICFSLGRKFIKPRYVILLTDNGGLQRIICKTKEKMLELASGEDCKGYCGECVSACGVKYLRGLSNGNAA